MHVANRVLACILQTLGMLENFGKVVATQQHESMVVNTTSNGMFVRYNKHSICVTTCE